MNPFKKRKSAIPLKESKSRKPDNDEDMEKALREAAVADAKELKKEMPKNKMKEA